MMRNADERGFLIFFAFLSLRKKRGIILALILTLFPLFVNNVLTRNSS